MNKAILLLFSFMVLFTMLSVTYEPGEGAIVVQNTDEKTYTWGGADYITKVDIELSDSLVTKGSGSESTYWYDMSLVDFAMLNDYEVQLDYTIESTFVSDYIQGISSESSKLANLNDTFVYCDQKSITSDNLTAIANELSNVPLTVKRGAIDRVQSFSVGNTYRSVVTLNQITPSVRQAVLKFGSNSFLWRVTSYQNWVDATLLVDNIFIEALNTGYITLDNATGGAGENWWNGSWGYRKDITLSGGVRPDNYELRLEIDKQDNLASNCEDDFSDLRFLDNDDAGLLDYWIENVNNGDNCVVWVELLDYQPTDNTIVCYYGNSDAPSVDNGRDTFDFFDDFLDATLDVTRWTEDVGAVAISGSVVTVNVDTLASIPSWTNDITVRMRMRMKDAFTSAGLYVSTRSQTRVDSDTSEHYAGGATRLKYSVPSAVWYVYEMKREAARQRYYIDDNAGADKTLTVSDTSADELQLYSGDASAYVWCDWVIIRSYMDNEATASFENEEAAGVGFENTGEWVSNNWELGVYSVIDNLIVFSGDDVRQSHFIEDHISYVPGFKSLTFIDNPVVEGDDFYYLVNNGVGTDNLVGLRTDLSFNGEGNLSNTGSAQGSCTDSYNAFYVLDDDNDEVDNYTTGLLYQGAIDISGRSLNPVDVDYRDDVQKFYVLDDSGIVYRWNYDWSYDGSNDLILSGTFKSLYHDNNYWYVTRDDNAGDAGLENFNKMIVRYDNNFVFIDNWRTLAGYDVAPRGFIIDENAQPLFVGTGTNTVYKIDNNFEVDNIYVQIGTDNNDDNVIDTLSGWALLHENGILDNWVMPDAYNYNLSFRLETDNPLWSPVVSGFRFNVDYKRVWTSAENWDLGFAVVEYGWIGAQSWDLGILMAGAEITPLLDIDNLMINVLIPLLIIFMFAFVLGQRIGRYGFMAGMILGVIVCYVAFGFGLGIVLLILAAAIMIWLRGDD